MKDLLLHTCCGPCGAGTFGFWREQGLEPRLFFYNPNIQPLLEYRRRLIGVRDLAEAAGLDLIEDLTYDPEGWFREVVAPGQRSTTGETIRGHADGPHHPRCARCIGMRLERTAAQASALGFTGFSTTLSLSPFQDHDAIRRSGAAAGEVHGVEFIYRDLRSRYPDSKSRSRELGLYRQKYCGCILSEWERYR